MKIINTDAQQWDYYKKKQKKQARFPEGDLIIERSNFNSFCRANSYIRNIMLEMNRLNVNILGVCKIRWPNNRDFVCDKHKIMYAGGDKKEWGGCRWDSRNDEMETKTMPKHGTESRTLHKK